MLILLLPLLCLAATPREVLTSLEDRIVELESRVYALEDALYSAAQVLGGGAAAAYDAEDGPDRGYEARGAAGGAIGVSAQGAQQQERHGACYKKLRGLKALCCGTEEHFDDHCAAGHACFQWARYTPGQYLPAAHIEWKEYEASLQAAFGSSGACQGIPPLAVAPRCQAKLGTLQNLARSAKEWPGFTGKFNITELKAELFQPGGDCSEDPSS